MASDLKILQRPSKCPLTSSSPTNSTKPNTIKLEQYKDENMPSAVVTNSAPALPLEIANQIVSYLSSGLHYTTADQESLRACTLISRTWYSAAIGLLYEHPLILGKKYEQFVRSICPSINTHVRKNGLADLVKVLDLGRLVHHGSKSTTARLLGRVKQNIEVFVAPQATFGYVKPTD